MKRTTASGLALFTLVTYVFTPLVLTPGLTIDAVNLGKFFFFMLAAVFSLLLLNQLNLSVFNGLAVKRVKFIFLTLLLGLFLPLLFSGAPVDQQIFGIWGRNLGLLTHLACFSALVFGMFLQEYVSERALKYSFFACSLISVIYGLFQSFGIDFVNWGQPQVFGTLGNINFYSAHIAIIFCMSIGYLSSKTASRKEKLVLVILMATCLVLLREANSMQGWIIVLACSFVAIHIHAVQRSPVFNLVTPFIVLALLVNFLVAIAGRGPLTDILNSELGTLKIRTYFWSAAMQMFSERPLMGVGFDSFEDWYRDARPEDAYRGGDFNEVADSAHNILLDYASMGGLFLALYGLQIIFLLLKSARKIISNTVRSPSLVSPISLMATFGSIGFLIQSMVSPQQIGLLSWGFLLWGVTLSENKKKYSIIDPNLPNRSKNRLKFRPSLRQKIVSTMGGLGMALIIALSMLPVLKEFQVLASQKQEDAFVFAANIKKFPKSAYLYRNGIQILETAGYHGKALELGLSGIDYFPRNYELLRTVSKLRAVDSTLKARINNQLEIIDPRR